VIREFLFEAVLHGLFDVSGFAAGRSDDGNVE